MKVSSIIQPPSLVSQLEGKSNEAIIKRTEEINQKALQKENIKDSSIQDDVCVQHLIDLLA